MKSAGIIALGAIVGASAFAPAGLPAPGAWTSTYTYRCLLRARPSLAYSLVAPVGSCVGVEEGLSVSMCVTPNSSVDAQPQYATAG